MSELRPNHQASDHATRSTPIGRPRPSVPQRPSPVVPVASDALAAAQDVLRTAPLSREALRTAVVRYGRQASDEGMHATEVATALEATLGPTLAHFPDAVARELRVHVAWWAAHGYHRAD